MTILDHLLQSLRLATHFNKHDVAAPSVILWTDGDPSLVDAVKQLVAQHRDS